MSLPFIYVDTDAALAEHCRRWQHCTVLAVDTEFIRERTFYPIAALLQVNDGAQVCLIDPLTIKDFSPFATLLRTESICKVLHSCSEDLDVFARLLNCCPAPIFDTQIAGIIAGYGPAQSYQKLVQRCLGVELEKGETRSDWLQRPLRDKQLIYAAHDVEYLLAVYRAIEADLQKLGREDWCREDCQRVIDDFTQPPAPENYYLKFKSAYKLKPSQLSVLQQLGIWREQEARRCDVPRSRILHDAECIEIAQHKVKKVSDLSRIKDLSFKQIERFGEQIIAVVNAAAVLPEAQWPPALPAPLSRDERDLLQAMRDAAAQVAESLAMPVEILVKKRDYEALIISGRDGGQYALPPSLTGWRRELAKDALFSVLPK